MKFPTAFEMKYRSLLENLQEKMESAHRSFLDVNMCNDEVEKYLRELGYSVTEIRYQYVSDPKPFDGPVTTNGNGQVFGYFGRKTGDGQILNRISWGDHSFNMNCFGDYR